MNLANNILDQNQNDTVEDTKNTKTAAEIEMHPTNSKGSPSDNGDEPALLPSVPKNTLAALAADEFEATQEESEEKTDGVTPLSSIIVSTDASTTTTAHTDKAKNGALEKTTKGIKQAFKSINKFSAKTNRQMNEALLQRPVNSLHSIGEAVKRKKASKSTNSKNGYTSLSKNTVATEQDDNLPAEDKQFYNYGNDTTLLDVMPTDVSTSGGPKMGNDSFYLTDTYIFWAIVFSILAVQLLDNWDEILKNHFTFGTVLGAMFLAFAIGLEIDQESFLEDFKTSILGFGMVPHEETTWENCRRNYNDNRVDKSPKSASKQPKKQMNFIRRIFNKRSLKKIAESKQMQAFTSLNRRFSNVNIQRNEDDVKKNEAFMKSLARFSKKKSAHMHDPKSSEKPMDTVNASTLSQESTMSDISMGYTSIANARAVDLLEDVPTPLCCIRGLDLFKTEDPDPEMISHPFLIENGLRDFPTFFINILTAYGNILVYFKLPDWVRDWDESLIEQDDDPSDVVALKRFLKGDEDYKTKRFKIMPELVDGPLPVRLLAPQNTEFPLDFQGFMSTSYTKEPATDEHCPTMCLTLDLISNATIRGLVGIFKRNMHRMTVDFACVISSGDEEEPSAILGLWRMDHLEAEHYPHLPDRYSAEDNDPEKADSIRGSLLIKRVSQSQSQLQQSMIEVIAETAL